jgi:hypothetical protein
MGENRKEGYMTILHVDFVQYFTWSEQFFLAWVFRENPLSHVLQKPEMRSGKIVET